MTGGDPHVPAWDLGRTRPGLKVGSRTALPDATIGWCKRFQTTD